MIAATSVAASRRRQRPPKRNIAYLVLIVAALLVPALFFVAQRNQPQQVTGFVTDVRTKPPLGVDSFDLLAGDGRTLTFKVGDLDLSTGFDAAHLVTHKVTLAPVIVWYRTDGDQLVAVKLADGPVPASIPPLPTPS